MTFHRFCWYELLTSDPKAAQAFYEKVLGWTSADAGVSDRSYTLFNIRDGGVAGVMAIPEHALGMQPNWAGYISVENVDAKLAQNLAEGGQTWKPAEDIPGVGRFAVAADPQGAGFCLFKPLDGGEAPAGMEILGQVGWHELMTSDAKSAMSYYNRMFGWKVVETLDMGEMGDYYLFGDDRGKAVGGAMVKPAEMPTSFWSFYVNVDGLRAALARVKDAGGTVCMGPIAVPGGSWVANCQDPQGAYFSMISSSA